MSSVPNNPPTYQTVSSMKEYEKPETLKTNKIEETEKEGCCFICCTTLCACYYFLCGRIGYVDDETYEKFSRNRNKNEETELEEPKKDEFKQAEQRENPYGQPSGEKLGCCETLNRSCALMCGCGPTIEADYARKTGRDL